MPPEYLLPVVAIVLAGDFRFGASDPGFGFSMIISLPFFPEVPGRCVDLAPPPRPALRIVGIAWGDPVAAEDDPGPKRIHPAPPPYAPRLHRHRAGFLIRAARSTGLRAGAVRACERFVVETDHNCRAEAA